MKNSEKILLQGKEFYVDADALEDPKVQRLFLFTEPSLQIPAKSIGGLTRMVRKEDLEDVLKEYAGGAGGAGYAVYGGGWGRNFGNPSQGGRFFGRGFGFGNGSTTGPNLMYTYSVKPLDPILQQPGTPQGDERYIHVGSEVIGKEFNGDVEIQGKVLSVKEDEEGNIIHYVVQDFDTSEKIEVDPTSVSLVSHEELPNSMIDFAGSVVETFYPRLSEAQKFERGKSPKGAMGIGQFVDQLVKILNNVFFQYQPGCPVITKSGEKYMDCDGGEVDPNDIIEWALEILDEYENEIELDEKMRERLKKDIKKRELSGFYPMDEKIGKYSSMWDDMYESKIKSTG
jgi:hypothetical protein